MPKYYITLLLAYLLSPFVIHAQCNYSNSILATCNGNYRAYSQTVSPKTSVQMGSDFLFAALLKCDNSVVSTNLELVLFDACGNIIKRTFSQLHCSNGVCLLNARVFAYTQDTALLAVYGSALKLFKVSRNLDILPLLSDSTFKENFLEAQILPNGKIGVLYNTALNGGLKIYQQGNLLFNHVNSSLTPNGFWISLFAQNKLYGHGLHNPSKFLELTLDSNGNIFKDTLFGTTAVSLDSNNYAFSKDRNNVLKHVAIAQNNGVTIYPINNYALSAPILTQNTFIEQSFSKIIELKITDSGEMVLNAIPESFLWDKANNLVSVIPRKPSYYKPGGTSAYIIN